MRRRTPRRRRGGDELKRDVGGQRHTDHAHAVLKGRDHELGEVVHEEDRTDEDGPQAQFLHVLLDVALAVEMRDPAVALGASDRGVDHVGDADVGGRLGDRPAVLLFPLRAPGARRGHDEQPGHAGQGLAQTP